MRSQDNSGLDVISTHKKGRSAASPNSGRYDGDLLYFERQLWQQGLEWIAGVDEAGRGPLAGPVVAAAVVFPAGQPILSGINDSKKLSAAQRDAAYQVILQEAVEVGVGVVSETEIDEINILQATYRAMLQAVNKLASPPQHLLIDGRGKPETLYPVTTLIKGDSRSLSIAAASIIAKVTRDRLMLEYHDTYPQYGFGRHKGYPTKAHLQAIRQHGWCPIHRRSFHPKNL
jgi:ribonuclease HII